MPLLSLAPHRYVLLVVDDRARSITTRLRCSPLAAEVVACSSAQEAWSALTSGRRYSAVVTSGINPDLTEAAARAATPVLAVGRGLPPAALASAVTAAAAEVPRGDQPPLLGPRPRAGSFPGRPRADGRLVAVCGPGGTGASSLAAALARHLASDPPALAARPHPPTAGQPAVESPRAEVLLADLALRADQAFLHRLGEHPPGLLPLVAAGRYHPITLTDLRRHSVVLEPGGHRLLPGLRRPGHWTAVSPGLFDEALAAVLDLFDQVVADITGDFEGEAETGSIDVEERNHMARRTARSADAVVVVGGSGTNGTRRLALLVNDLLDLGVDPARIQPAVTRCTGFVLRTRHKSSVPGRICGLPAIPIELPFLPGGAPGLLPPRAVLPVATAVTALLERLAVPNREPALVAVAPGSLGCSAP